MTNAAMLTRMSAAQYLEWERGQPGKHEFHDGEVYAMAGGSPRHNLLSSAIAAELRTATRALGCHTLSSDQRIAVTPQERYVYADAVVVCGKLETEPGAHDVLRNPSVIVEVLSSSTESHDRGMKWTAYQRLASLTDYMMLSQTQARIEHYRREADGWHYQVLGPGDGMTLANGARLDVDAIYAGAFDVEGG
jgi:Uma2 family endonuclease